MGMAADFSPRSGASDSLSALPLSGESVTPAKGVRVAWPHVVLSVLGLAASAYATYAHFLIKAGQDTGCGITDTISCDKVIGSQYGVVFGIPLGIFGALFWAIVLITAISSHNVSPRSAALQRLVVGTVGLTTSIVLAYISLGVLHKLCLVCATTHILSGINFLVALAGFWKLRALTAIAPR
ncbi:hypothetical protein IAD21_03626 [Abditibacteriota bacterium]|nr:hypothetical protein IAD21_03626 [Abditibacteriota bacterium]